MSPIQRIFSILLTITMLFAGIGHFTLDDAFTAIVPAWLPAPRLLVHISGVIEILLAIALQIPGTRRLAAWGLVALFIAVFPANINMAVHDIRPEGLELTPAMQWARLPFQAVFIAWAWWMTRQPRASGPVLSDGSP